MALPLRASQVPVKYERSREAHRPGRTIYEVSGSGLYRVTEASRGEFDVATLTQFGWTDLIRLDESDDVSTALEAMQAWLDIQTPTLRPDDGDTPHG
ncbi:hypothetical protein [Nocardiopsis metallicus]|uniref:Uncharacterized protein n=1 Tax=Nocardiopsis metallicus TaxID=179819 RepID=A0A840W7Q2_9ACTN|nr:hypothetical protein [Nocardiopsis metallicus]MBB5491383.1 hypothetical protein [Nocardiopsis metallicus]